MELVYWVLALTCLSMAATLHLIIADETGKWLSAYLGFLAGYLGLILLDAQSFYISPQLYFLLLPVIFLPGPFILGYVSHISTRRYISAKDFIICLLPVMIVATAPGLLGETSLFSTATYQDYETGSYTALFNLISAMAGVQTLAYLATAMWVLLRMRKDWASYQSKTLPDSWFRMIQAILVFMVTTIAQVISAFSNPSGDSVSFGDIAFIGSVLYFIWLAVSTAINRLKSGLAAVDEIILQEADAISQPPLPPANLSGTHEENIAEQNTGRQSDEAHSEELTAIGAMVSGRVGEEQLFLQDDLSLAILAGHVGQTTHKVSEAINTVFGRSFYEFINDFRVKYAAEKLISQPELSITEIYFEAGFTTKSTFYGYFKKTFNCTPTEYRKRASDENC